MFIKTVLPLLVVALATFEAHGALIPLSKAKVASNGLTYIGSLNNLNPATGSYRRSVYYMSPNDASWADAREDCKTFLGPQGTLLYLQTQVELQEFVTWHDGNPGTASNYWVGGEWSVINNRFQWADGTPIASWLPWGVGQPETSLPVTRVEFRPVDNTFATEFDSTDSRYICEVEVDGNPDPCYEDNDLIIVVDSSGSIGTADYEIAKDFTKRLAMAWAANPGSRVSVITYADTVTTHVRLSANADPNQLAAIIDSIVYVPGGGTGTDIALDAVLAEFTANPRGVPKNMVLLTDGLSSYPVKTLLSAEAVTAAGIDGFSIGITSHVEPAELLAIAGFDPTHVFNTPDFNGLLALLKQLSQIVCP